MTTLPTPATAPAASGRVQRAVLSWGVGMAAQVIIAGIGFFATPLLLRWLGSQRFGSWMALSEWMGYLALFQMAVSGPILVLLLRARGAGDRSALSGLVHKGLWLYVAVVLVTLPAGFWLVWRVPAVIPIAARYASQLRWAAAISLVPWLTVPLQIYRCVLEVEQRSYWNRFSLFLQSLVVTGLSLWLVWNGWGLLGLAVASAIGLTLGHVLTAYWGRASLPPRSASKPVTLSRLEFWRLGWPVTLAGLGNRLNLMTDNIVVAALLGPAAVAVFYVTQRLMLFLGRMVNDLSNISWAGLSEMRAGGAPHAFSDRVVELSATVLGLGFVLLGSIAAFNRDFVSLWVGSSNYGGEALTWVTAAGGIVFAYLCFFASLLDTQGDARRRLPVSSMGSALNLLLSLALAWKFGLVGVALGTLIAYLASDVWNTPRLVSRLYGVSGVSLVRAALRATFWGLLWGGGVAWLVSRLPPSRHWLQLALNLSWVLACGAIYAWTLILSRRDRALWRERWSAWRQRSL